MDQSEVWILVQCINHIFEARQLVIWNAGDESLESVLGLPHCVMMS